MKCISGVIPTSLERGSTLRILDSKDPEDIKVVTNAPMFSSYISAKSKERFDQVLEALEKLGIKYTLNPRLVRGLDYYSHTIFEFVAKSEELGKKKWLYRLTL